MPNEPSVIFLIGYRGTGKTTTGQLLAAKLGFSFVDADALLEQRFGRTIRLIFAEEGEAGFRDREAEILRELANLKNHVIATGGGVILRPENRELLRQGVAIWLRAEPQVIWQRLQGDGTTSERRPNLAQGGLAEIEQLLQIRTPLYEACHDFTLDTSQQDPEAVAQRILLWLSAPHPTS